MSTALRAMLGAAFFLPLGVRAHHSIVVHYDPTNIRSIAGTLESVTWTNPHSKWVFSVKNDEGVVQTWRAEGDAVNTLVRNGLTKEHFQAGSGITVIGPVARSGRNEMIAAQVVVGGVTYGIFPALADELSEELPQESQQTLTSAAGYEISYSPAPDLFRVWTPVDFPATGVRPQEIALTDTARASLASTILPVTISLPNASPPGCRACSTNPTRSSSSTKASESSCASRNGTPDARFT
jgi:hypothetical protein